MKLILSLLVVATLCGCGQSPEDSRRVDTNGSATHGRFNLQLSETFRDPSAHDGYREVYLLTDTKTGREYVGVSGIGISEVIQSGKTTSEQ